MLVVTKKNIYEAALLSIWNFKWAITAGTMTTVSAFLPMLLVSGIMGEYISILPKTISVTLISSLFVALIVIPTFATRFIKIENGNGGSHRNKKRHLFFAKQFDKLYSIYTPIMRKVLPSKRLRRSSIFVSVALFVIAIIIPVSGLMEIQMFPKTDLDYFVVNGKAPVGSNLETTRPIAINAENVIREIPEMDNYVLSLGASQSFDPVSGGGSGENLFSFTVNLIDKDERDRKSYEIAESIRSKLKNIQGAEVTVEELSAGPPTGAPIEVRIYGDEIKDLANVTDEVKGFFANIPGVINIDDNIDDSAGEYTFSIDKQKANYYGLDMFTIASTLRTALYGSEATEVNIAGDDIAVVVKYDKDKFETVNDLENIIIFSATGQSVNLKQVAKVDFNPALLSIRHRDGKKFAAMSADIEKGTRLQDVLADFEEFKKDMSLPEGVSVEVGGEVEDIQKSFRETFLSMGVAIILIAFILVLQFNSFKQPFIILFALPLAVIGVIFGLALLGQPFSFLAFIGIVSLAGIVVNDAIVLIDRINKNIDNGMDFHEGIVEAGTARMQPIFLTSITTIAGVFPLIYANEFWRGFSLTVTFGLLSSTVLILYMIPIIYSSMCYGEKCSREVNK